MAEPEAAFIAAAEELHDLDCDDGDVKDCGRWQAGLGNRGLSPELVAHHARHIAYYQDRARAVIAAVRPLIEAEARADERQRIRQMALDAVGDCPNGTCCLPLFADLLGDTDA